MAVKLGFKEKIDVEPEQYLRLKLNHMIKLNVL
jgi:hypothetical protein